MKTKTKEGERQMAKQEEATAAAVVKEEVTLGKVLQLMSSQLAVGNQLATQVKTLNIRIKAVQAKLEHMSATRLDEHFSKDNLVELDRIAGKTLKELQEAVEASAGQEKFLNKVLNAPIDAPPIAERALEEREVTSARRKEMAEKAVRGGK
jgi:hypothetical protein